MRFVKLAAGLAALLSLASCLVVFDADRLNEGCPEGEKNCDGVCVSTQDPEFGCARATCAPCVLGSLHILEAVCGSDGDCGVASCEDPYSNCDNVPSNGCEVNLETSNEHCGRCNQSCTELFPNKPHVAATTCIIKNCAVDYCDEGFADCDKVFGNGCEVNTTNDPAHCGGCDQPCAGGCSGGICDG